MDDRTGTSTLAKAVLGALGFLVALLLGRAVLGELGAQLVLLATMVIVAAMAWTQLTGKALPRPGLLSREALDPAPSAADTWRSERWITEAVERGLRALDEWRLEQREA